MGSAVGGIFGAIGSMYAAGEQSDATEDAAETQAEAMIRAQEMRNEIFERGMELQEPYRAAGYSVLPQLQMETTGQAPQMSESEIAEMEGLRAKQKRAGDILKRGGPVENWEQRLKQKTSDNLGVGRTAGEQRAREGWQPPIDPESIPEGELEKTLRQHNLWQTEKAAEHLTEDELKRLHELQTRKQQYEQMQGQVESGNMPTALDMMDPEQRKVYNRLTEFTQGPLEESPYYQWRLGEGENAINRAMAARGLQSSRPAINELSDYTRALTGEMTQQRYNRLGQQYNTLEGIQLDRFNRLSQLANIGQGATAQSVNTTSQYGGDMANMIMQGGQQQANNQLMQGNIQANMWGNLGAMPMNMLNTYALQQAAGGGGSSGTGTGTFNDIFNSGYTAPYGVGK